MVGFAKRVTADQGSIWLSFPDYPIETSSTIAGRRGLNSTLELKRVLGDIPLRHPLLGATVRIEEDFSSSSIAQSATVRA
jgi:hypothetical protein